MAIPVSNPPPPYEPAPPPRRDRDEPALPPGPPFRGSTGGPGGLDPRMRGCMIALGVAAALACIGSVGIAIGCRGCMQMGEAQATRQIAAGYRAATSGSPTETGDLADLRALEQLGDAGSISIVPPLTDDELAAGTVQVQANADRMRDLLTVDCAGGEWDFPIPMEPGQESPIKRVVLVVRENKTYDAQLGALRVLLDQELADFNRLVRERDGLLLRRVHVLRRREALLRHLIENERPPLERARHAHAR